MTAPHPTVAETTVEAQEVPPYSMLLEWDPEDRIYVVSVPELHGCHTHGATYDEAARRGRVMIADWVAALRGSGQPIPPARHWQP